MAQQTEFIPYEQALELKELGFNEPTLTYYFDDGTIRTGLSISLYNGWTYEGVQKMLVTLAPLYQQAFRWFREKYNLHHFIERDGYVYYAVCQHSFNEACKTYEEAELACLKKLIEIVKNK